MTGEHRVDYEFTREPQNILFDKADAMHIGNLKEAANMRKSKLTHDAT